jgi:hypothetical protein
MSVGIWRPNILILFWEAAQFHFWEHINGNQTFILDSHRPFICSVVSKHMQAVFIPIWKKILQITEETKANCRLFSDLCDLCLAAPRQ